MNYSNNKNNIKNKNKNVRPNHVRPESFTFNLACQQ